MKKFLPLLLLSVFLIIGPSCASLAPSIATFDANPAVITAGESTTLIWNISGTNAVSIDQGLGAVSAGGSQIVFPTATTIYTLTASNLVGTTSKSIIVNVNPAPIVINFDVNPAVINSGASAALIWSVSNANAVSIDQGIGGEPLTGNKLVSPTDTTTYTLTASGPAGTVTKSVVLSVNAPIVAVFNIDPNIIAVGSLATLHWDVTGATSVSIDQGIGDVPLVGSKVVYPYYTTAYTLTASSSCCSVSKAAVLTVGNYYPYQLPFGYPYGLPPTYPYRYGYPYIHGPIIDIFNISPSTSPAGYTVILSWHVTGANTVIISGIGMVPSSGSVSVSPGTTTTYVLTAINDFASTTGSVTVQVQ
jgi:3D (Asp-Asp-Asp) domain-containing protein